MLRPTLATLATAAVLAPMALGAPAQAASAKATAGLKVDAKNDVVVTLDANLDADVEAILGGAKSTVDGLLGSVFGLLGSTVNQAEAQVGGTIDILKTQGKRTTETLQVTTKVRDVLSPAQLAKKAPNIEQVFTFVGGDVSGGEVSGAVLGSVTISKDGVERTFGGGADCKGSVIKANPKNDTVSLRVPIECNLDVAGKKVLVSVVSNTDFVKPSLGEGSLAYDFSTALGLKATR